MSERYGDESEDGDWLRIFFVGAVAGALMVGFAWLGMWWYSTSIPERSQAVVSSGQSADQPTVESSELSVDTSHRARCRSVHETQSAALEAAAGSLSQWEVHIGAMNKLVTGAISLEQARQFWDQTRVGAHAKLRKFATARRPYDQRIYACPPPRAAEANRELEECHRAVAARGRTLRLATTSLERWEQHVHHMDMLRSGDMTPQQATRLWLRHWREGDREVRAYRSSTRTGKGPTC